MYDLEGVEEYNNTGALLGIDGIDGDELLGALRRMNPIARAKTINKLANTGPHSKGSRAEMEKFFGELPPNIKDALVKGELRLADTVIYSIKQVSSKTIKMFETQDSKSVGICNVSTDKSFIFIFQTTKEGKFKGANTFQHDVDSVHSLKPEHRKTLLIALRLFYPGKDYNPRCKRNSVWQFFAERYPFTDKEMQDLCDVTPLENLFDLFTDLPLQSKIAIVLIVNCILNIDKNATEKQRLIAKSIYTILDISPEYYRAIMNEFKGANHHKGINYIYELA